MFCLGVGMSGGRYACMHFCAAACWRLCRLCLCCFLTCARWWLVFLQGLCWGLAATAECTKVRAVEWVAVVGHLPAFYSPTAGPRRLLLLPPPPAAWCCGVVHLSS